MLLPIHNSLQTSSRCPSFTNFSTSDEDFKDFGNKYLIQLQKEAEERAKQSRLDEELARNLSQGFQPSSSASQSGTANNAFDRLSGAHLIPTSSAAASSQAGPTTGRKLPWETNIKPEPRSKSMSSGIKREDSTTNGYNSIYNSRPPIKSEASSSRTMPGAFKDDSSAASDSDIEIIPSTAFRDNGRHPQPVGNFQHPNQSVKRSPGSVAAGNAALNRAVKPELGALGMALWGDDKKHWPHWMSASGKPENNPFAGKNENVYQGPYGPIPSQGYTMSNIPVYPGSVAGPSNTVGQPLVDPNVLDNIISRSGHQNYDELSRHLGLDASMNDRLDYIVNDPRKTNQEIKDLLEGIGTGDDLPPENREGTPVGMKYPLVSFLRVMGRTYANLSSMSIKRSL